ncbi:methyltransferase domain-containing protein [Metabacillus herbersteinensis]|uniref:Methyltransferase domain-containing protein n=1 Tax=Metabacillus herbersteinensis TaxID=283816 RepID=A0ABV6GG86_9BACI
MSDFFDFLPLANQIEKPRILEIGTRRVGLNPSTVRKDLFNDYKEYVGLDYQEGLDVDIVGDVHELSKVVGEESFDIILTCATFEHIKYPFLAAHEILKALKVNGLLALQAPQTFPLHGFPYDYCRFSTEALKALVGTEMGFNVLNSGYDCPASIVSEDDPNCRLHEAYLSCWVYGRKVSKTPKEFIYEHDN